MEAHIQCNALFNNIFSHTGIESYDISEVMKKLIYSKDGHQSLIHGSTKVDIEVLKDKTILLLISELDISPQDIESLTKIYEVIRKEEYYEIVWIPFVLKWTKEKRQKFENLKSKMPWCIVCYDSPIVGIWYFKGKWRSKRPQLFMIDPLGRVEGWPFSIYEMSISHYACFPYKRIEIEHYNGTALPSQSDLIIKLREKARTKGSSKALSNPPNGLEGLLG